MQVRDLWGFQSAEVSDYILATYDKLTDQQSTLWDLGGMPPPPKAGTLYAEQVMRFWKKLVKSPLLGQRNYANRTLAEFGYPAAKQEE